MSGIPILLKPSKVLLIGGGKVAYQKAKVLEENNIPFTTVAKEFIEGFKKIKTKRVKREFVLEDIKDYSYIIDATGNKDLTKSLRKQREKKFFLLNVVDQPEFCDFYFSSLLNYGDLKISVSTNGTSPKASQIIRDKIKTIIPKEIEQFLAECAKKRVQDIIDVEEISKTTKRLLGRVSLVGAGLGDVELLTLKAYKRIHEADVILYDNLISDEVLNIIPSHVERIYVGKEVGNHLLSQEEINELILQHALDAKHVVRLKSGDPLIFGRGWEEADYLLKKGVHVEIINGLSSAIAGPSFGGIALTKRETATSFSVVTAHLSEDVIHTEWLDLLQRKNHCVVVLMGLGFVKYIVEEAFKRYIDPNYPVAIVANASRPNQQTILTTLKDLEEDAKKAQRPAILIFGENVKYCLQSLQHLPEKSEEKIF